VIDETTKGDALGLLFKNKEELVQNMMVKGKFARDRGILNPARSQQDKEP